MFLSRRETPNYALVFHLGVCNLLGSNARLAWLDPPSLKMLFTGSLQIFEQLFNKKKTKIFHLKFYSPPKNVFDLSFFFLHFWISGPFFGNFQVPQNLLFSFFGKISLE